MAKGKNKKSGFIGKFIAVIVTLVILVVCICLTGFASRNQTTNKWFGNGDVHSWTLANAAAKDDDDGEEQPNNNGLSIATFALAAEDYAAYGISERAIEAKAIEVRFEPWTTSNRMVTMTLAWKNYSDWSDPTINEERIIEDYVELNQGADNSRKATIAVLQPFGDPLILTVTSIDDPSLTASVQIDYMARFDDFFNGGEYVAKIDSVDILNGLVSCDDYTITPTRYEAEYAISVEDAFYTWSINEGNDEALKGDITYFTTWTGALELSELLSSYNYSTYEAVQYYTETGNDVLFTLKAKIKCFYDDKELYTFENLNDILISEQLAKQWKVTANSMTVTPDRIIF